MEEFVELFESSVTALNRIDNTFLEDNAFIKMMVCPEIKLDGNNNAFINKFGKIVIKTYDAVVSIKSMNYTFQGKNEIKLSDVNPFANGDAAYRRKFLIALYEECVLTKKRLAIRYGGNKYASSDYINSMTLLYMVASQQSLDVHYTIKNLNSEILETYRSFLSHDLIYLKHLSKINMLKLNNQVANLLFVPDDIKLIQFNGVFPDVNGIDFDLNFFVKELSRDLIKKHFFELIYLLEYDILTLDSNEYEKSLYDIKAFIVNNQFYIKTLVTRRLVEANSILSSNLTNEIKDQRLAGFKMFLSRMIDDIKRNDIDNKIVSTYNNFNIKSLYRTNESVNLITELLPSIIYSNEESTSIIKSFQSVSKQTAELFDKLNKLLNEAFEEYVE